MTLSILLVIIGLITLLLTWLVFDLKRKMEGRQDQDKSLAILEKLAALSEQNSMLSEQNRELRRTMDGKLSETHRATQEQIGHSTKQIANVVAGLTKLEETNKQVVNFSAQLQNLQDILKNPKQRGVLGEYFLEETLKNVLPPNSYQMQYGFKDGVIVDAVVFVQKKIIPVDSKFSLENYERILGAKDAEERERWEKLFKQDLKNRIDETSKYIKPSEGTMDFAFMFIPSEAIYYDLLVNKVGAAQINTRDLIEYAFKDKKVIIVSPTSFLAYLQTVLQGLRALQIEESAKEIRANVEKLEKHLISFDEFMKKVHGSLGTTVNHFNTAYKELGKIEKDVVKITEGEKTIDPLPLDKPSVE
jgi:DNA recombination protein RmuC